MIFGIINEERQNNRKDQIYQLLVWHDWFAWRPVTLRDGRVAWLENVERLGKICANEIYFCYRQKEVLQRLDE